MPWFAVLLVIFASTCVGSCLDKICQNAVDKSECPQHSHPNPQPKSHESCLQQASVYPLPDNSASPVVFAAAGEIAENLIFQLSPAEIEVGASAPPYSPPQLISATVLRV